MLIAVIIGLACWAAAIGYLILPSIEYWQHGLRERNERTGNLLEGSARLAAGLGLFVVGFAMLIAVLPSSKVAALFFGPVFLGAAFWAFQHYRANWREFAGGGHHLQVLLHIFAIIAFPIIGIVILTAGL